MADAEGKCVVIDESTTLARAKTPRPRGEFRRERI